MHTLLAPHCIAVFASAGQAGPNIQCSAFNNTHTNRSPKRRAMQTCLQQHRCCSAQRRLCGPSSFRSKQRFAAPASGDVIVKAGRHDAPTQQPGVEEQQNGLNSLLQKAGHLAVAASLLLSPAAYAEEGGGTLLRLPASSIPEVFKAQQTMFEAWTIVGDSFVDEGFNGHWWPDELKAHMIAAYNSGSGQQAYQEIGDMLGELGDPYTRIIPPSEYADFRVSSDGELQGVGLLIANEPVNKHLLVLSAIKGGPADRAGITTGDEVISINDQPTEGWTGDMAAKLLRGKGGTEVRVKFVRRTNGIPGVAGRPEPRLPYYSDDSTTVKEVRLRREKVALSPVYYTALQADAITPVHGFSMASAPPVSDDEPAIAAMGSMLGQQQRTSASGYSASRRPLNAQPAAVTEVAPRLLPGEGPRWGYLRLTSFSQNAAEETQHAIQSLERKGVSGYILDLRDNPGGLVKAGLDIARLLLDGHPTVFSIVGRAGEAEQKVILGQSEEGELEEAAQQAITHKPMVVLVNKHSASASEILSGALHDNGRATLVGDTPTYGKGRIQSVYELHDGSALFVTVAKYVTPAGTVIDKRGIKPDTSCDLGALADRGAPIPDSEGMLAMASSFVPGMPVGVGAEEALVSALSSDPCVLKAASVLTDKAAVVRSTAQVASSLPRLF